jgi:hypothetical protein
MNIHFGIEGLQPRYPLVLHGVNAVAVRDRIAAVVLRAIGKMP